MACIIRGSKSYIERRLCNYFSWLDLQWAVSFYVQSSCGFVYNRKIWKTSRQHRRYLLYWKSMWNKTTLKYLSNTRIICYHLKVNSSQENWRAHCNDQAVKRSWEKIGPAASNVINLYMHSFVEVSMQWEKNSHVFIVFGFCRTTGPVDPSWDQWFEGPQNLHGHRCWILWYVRRCTWKLKRNICFGLLDWAKENCE